MGANIITGYTGTRHITPAMDAAVYRSTFGLNNYILSDGNQLEGSMPSVNEFTVLDGLVSMQGHQIQVTQETLSVDTCANGYKRIDLVCMRYEHDNNSQVDSASLIVIKGAEVADPNEPVAPDYNTGDIDSGASVVDFPLYRIDLAGSTVAFIQLATVIANTINTISDIQTSLGGVKLFSAYVSTTTDSAGIFTLSNPSGSTQVYLLRNTYSDGIGSSFGVLNLESVTATTLTIRSRTLKDGSANANKSIAVTLPFAYR